jgi:hypothetical protein
MDQIVQFKPAPVGAVATRIVVMRTAPDGSVLESRVSILDSEAALAQCDDIAIERFGLDGWPLLRATYSAMYVGSGWVGAVGWSVVIDPGSMTMIERFPDLSWRQSVGGREASDVFQVNRVDEQTIEVSGTQRTFRYACGTPCRVPVASVLVE